MAIPDFQSTMLPLLQFAGDGKEHSLRESIDALADHFRLAEAERKELLPSGYQPILDNRVSWARTYLTRAGLLKSTRRGHYAIADLGRQVLAENPDRLSTRFLMQFEAFREFHTTRRDRSASESVVTEEKENQSITPEESLESAYERLREELANEILQQVKAMS